MDSVPQTFLLVVTIAVWWLYIKSFSEPSAFSKTKLFSVLGLYVDMWGVAIASLKTPYYGLFLDGGAIEVKRQNAERKVFQLGMFLVGIGLVFQALGVLL